MSDVKEISSWISLIQEAIWNGLWYSSKEVMDAWSVFIVSRMRTNRQNPSPKPISIWEGRLAKAIQGGQESSDNGEQGDTIISYERTIKVPYGAISEYGGKTKATPSARKAMFATLKKLGTYDPKKSWTNREYFEHPAFEFVNSSISEISMDTIQEPIMRNLEKTFNQIPDIEVVIGN